MKQYKISAVKMTNVYGKELLYVVLGDQPNNVIINVGKKTWEAVDKLINPAIYKDGIEVNPQLEKKGSK